MNDGLTTEARRWREEFIRRLRATNVPGPVIGDVLKTADAHVAEDGGSYRETFGDPVEYADSLGIAHPTPISTYLLILPAFFGAIFVATSIPGILNGTRTAFTVADVAGWILVLLGMAVVVALLGKLERPGPAVGVTVVLMVAGAVVASILGSNSEPWFEVNAWVVFIGGLILLGWVLLVTVREARANRITDPVTGVDMVELDNRWVGPLTVLLPVGMLVLIVVLSLVTA